MPNNFADIVRYLEYLAFRYPKIIELVTIGKSYEGQPIKMAKISTGLNKDGERKPAIWIDAGKFLECSFLLIFHLLGIRKEILKV